MEILFNDLSLQTSLNLLDEKFVQSLSGIRGLSKKYDISANIKNIIEFEQSNKSTFEELEEALGSVTFLKKIADEFNPISWSPKIDKLYYIKSKLIENQDVSYSILDYAFQEQIQNRYILIINMLDKEYSLRTFIPIFSVDLEKYQLLNLPCFNVNQVDEVNKYFYCIENILPLLVKKDKIQEIIKTYIEESKMLSDAWNISFDCSKHTQTLFRLIKTTKKIVEYSVPISNEAQKIGNKNDKENTNSDTAFKNNPTLAEKIAKILAEINGWKKDEKRSSINHKKGRGQRDVYEPNRNYQGTILYISVDTEKGEFEVHTHEKGKNHKGSIYFNLEKYGKRDPNKELYHNGKS